MKVIDKIEIEYVVPESDKEKNEIESIIRDFEDRRKEKIDLSKFKKVTPKSAMNGGYWRVKNGN